MTKRLNSAILTLQYQYLAVILIIDRKLNVQLFSINNETIIHYTVLPKPTFVSIFARSRFYESVQAMLTYRGYFD